MGLDPIGRLASGIVTTEFDYITGVESTSLLDTTSGWLGANVGQLNTLIYTDFYSGQLKSGCSGWTESGARASGWLMGPEEEAIYKQVYLQEYYNKQARKILRSATNITETSGIASDDYQLTEWTSLREGDTHIQREAIILSATQKNESAKIVRGIATSATEELKRLIHSYNMYNASPRQVAGDD